MLLRGPSYDYMNKSLKNPVILNRYIQFHGKQTTDILDVNKPQWELDFEETIPRIKFHPEVSEVSMREQAIDHLTNCRISHLKSKSFKIVSSFHVNSVKLQHEGKKLELEM